MQAAGELVKLTHLSRVAKAIVRETSIHRILERLMNAIEEIFSPENCSILLLDRRTDQLEFKMVAGHYSSLLSGQRIPAFEGIAGWVVAHGTELIVDDVQSDPRFSQRIDMLSGFTTRSIIAVPLKTDDRVFGVIELLNKLDNSPFSPPELHFLSTIAEFAAIAIEKAVYLNKVKRQAMSDALTGLLNRRGLARVLQREQARMEREGGQLAFILADIDDFKRINDQHGHAVGDVVLRLVSEALVSACRGTEYIARYGGDEFLIILPNTSMEQARLVRQRLESQISDKAACGDPCFFTVSFGVHAGSDLDLDTLLKESDKDMYRRKEERYEQEFSEAVIEEYAEELD